MIISVLFRKRPVILCLCFTFQNLSPLSTKPFIVVHTCVDLYYNFMRCINMYIYNLFICRLKSPVIHYLKLRRKNFNFNHINLKVIEYLNCYKIIKSNPSLWIIKLKKLFYHEVSMQSSNSLFYFIFIDFIRRYD